MPNRGGRGRTWRNPNNDDHNRNRSGIKKVSFKPNKNPLRRDLDVIDDDMGSTGEPSRRPFNKNFGGRDNRNFNQRMVKNGPPNRMKRKFTPGLLHWYQVMIPYGAKHDKNVLMSAILSAISPEIFIPHYFKTEGHIATFYIDDVKIAEKLFYASRSITMPDGFKLIMIVKNHVPQVTVNDELKEKIKLALASRYNPETKALDLTKFHTSPELIDIFCVLFRPTIMLATIDIIADAVPDLVAINFNDNKIQSLDHLKILASKFKALKIIYFGDNRISHINSLNALSNLPLVELYLKGNPFTNKYNDQDIYISDVRKKFPKLMKLDGMELPPVIGFDVEERSELPSEQPSFLVDPSAQEFVKQFLTQYFAVFDSDSRLSLLDAYHDASVLTLCASYKNNDYSVKNKLNSYFNCSHNLLRLSDTEARRKQLYVGKLDIVAFLAKLPLTSHNLLGFKVYVMVYKPTMIMMTVNGMFEERSVDGNPIRSFRRSYVIVPNNSGGFCILNEMIHISTGSKEEAERDLALNAAPPAPVAIQQAAPIADDQAMKMQLINMVRQRTGMNEQWSMNCLQENAWDLDRSVFLFNKLQTEGKIPPEAFIT